MDNTKEITSYLGPLGIAYNAYQERKKEPYSQQAPKQNIMGQIVSLFFGVFAAYLSWTCNTVEGISVPMKVFYAFFAFSFGPLYLVIYAMMRGFKVCA